MTFFVHDGNEAAKDFLMEECILTECLLFFSYSMNWYRMNEFTVDFQNLF